MDQKRTKYVAGLNGFSYEDDKGYRTMNNPKLNDIWIQKMIILNDVKVKNKG